MKAALVLGLVASLLVVAGSAAASDSVVERGIVQSIGPTAVVLRALDGTDVTVALGPDTRFRLNGVPVRRHRIGAGLVVRAFGRTAPSVRTGTVARLGPHALVLRLRGGARMSIPLTDRTAVRRAGRELSLDVLRRGMWVRVRLGADGSATFVTVLRR